MFDVLYGAAGLTIYFATAAAAAVLAVRGLRRAAPGPSWTRALPWVALASFSVTWFYIGRFTWGTTAGFDSAATWAAESELFFEAYAQVSLTASQWWWSSQLLIWVVTLMIFFEVTSRRTAFRRTLATMWLGLTIAISVTFPLYFRRVHGILPTRSDDRVHPTTVIAAAAALLAIGWMPSIGDVHDPRFADAVSVLHSAWLVPGVVQWLGWSERPKIPAWALYFAVAAGALVLHGITFQAAWSSLDGAALSRLGQFVGAIFTNDCQKSISTDLIVSTSVMCVWMIRERPGLGLPLALLTPILSPGVVFPLYLGLQSRR